MSIQRREIKFPSVEPGQVVGGEIYSPDVAIRGIVQFAVGMSDYGGRYQHFFTFLAENGFVAAYHDHLGHGKTASCSDDLGYIAAEDGSQKLIDDFDRFYDLLAEKYPSVPHFVMGHSMGSFVVRCFMARGKSQGAIIMGTANKNFLIDLALGFAWALAKIKGPRYRSHCLVKLVFGRYNKGIKDSNQQWAWLSTVAASQRDILDNPNRNKLFTAVAFRDLFQLTKWSNQDSTMAKKPPNMPLLFISGAEDPLGPYEAGIMKLGAKFRQKGFTDVTVELFPGARHELCHEEEATQRAVFRKIITWLEVHCDAIEERKSI